MTLANPRYRAISSLRADPPLIIKTYSAEWKQKMPFLYNFYQEIYGYEFSFSTWSTAWERIVPYPWEFVTAEIQFAIDFVSLTSVAPYY